MIFDIIKNKIQEIDYLKRHDATTRWIINAFDVPSRTAEDIIMFIRRNGGVFPGKRRKKEFPELTESQLAALETIVAEGFAGFDQQ